jgi:catechol 2,3-dioxygenase-like lactoylglutathione lyase family enzyme
MSATRVNHVSVHAPDLATSVAWYEDLFGARRIPTPNFGLPVQWLGIGDTQVHLFQRDADAPSHHHFALAVDDFPSVYRRAGDLAAYDYGAFGHHFFELPGDAAQLYLRDPGGNLVEVDAPGLSGLPEEILADRKLLADVHPQDAENLRGRLYLDGAGAQAQSSAASPVAYQSSAESPTA